ncbi:Rapid alkalinization factor [Apostasia shenzhenica]|uniref:Rapid alkalinization factor n=1 Tax=Apostasia shenzhenica TaxID=1088818 RepID=A0A2I0BC38_9ASPA|nr:Rapid alkalinization factor [Apostasia shenzhenica]
MADSLLQLRGDGDGRRELAAAPLVARARVKGGGSLWFSVCSWHPLNRLFADSPGSTCSADTTVLNQFNDIFGFDVKSDLIANWFSVRLIELACPIQSLHKRERNQHKSLLRPSRPTPLPCSLIFKQMAAVPSPFLLLLLLLLRAAAAAASSTAASPELAVADAHRATELLARAPSGSGLIPCDRMEGNCVGGGGGGEDEKAAEAAGRRFISYAALMKERVLCSRFRNSDNCGVHQKANPYSRGCSVITRCRDHH